MTHVCLERKYLCHLSLDFVGLSGWKKNIYPNSKKKKPVSTSGNKRQSQIKTFIKLQIRVLFAVYRKPQRKTQQNIGRFSGILQLIIYVGSGVKFTDSCLEYLQKVRFC